MKIVGLLIVGGLVYMTVLTLYATSPQTTHWGYEPEQPVKYSHALHVGQLGLDCRYCHVNVEVAAAASVPPTQTCMNCHAAIRTTSPLLQAVRDSYSSGMPVEWIKVHDLPDFVYFNHSAHVARGIGCVSCHGRVDQMEVVQQQEWLSMGWCLDCHRSPEKHLRPRELVTSMDYVPPDGDQIAAGLAEKAKYNINPPTDCWACHR